MIENFVDRIIEKLKLNKSDRYDKILSFMQTVSYYKLAPYIEFATNNIEFSKNFPESKDLWDIVILLYRYNIKISNAVYPLISLLETTLKTKLNNELTYSLGNNWFKDEQIFYKAFNFNEQDKTILEAYYPYNELDNEKLDKIKEFYYKSISDITESQIKKRISKIKSCIYLIRPMIEYCKRKESPDLMEFVEDETTLGYWVAIVKNNYFWKSDDVNLEKLFIKPDDDLLLINKKQIIKKLDGIRILRNNISHHKQIIACNIYENQKLYDVYSQINEIINLLGCNDIEYMIGDLQCEGNIELGCHGNKFETVYREVEFIHNQNIKAL